MQGTTLAQSAAIRHRALLALLAVGSRAIHVKVRRHTLVIIPTPVKAPVFRASARQLAAMAWCDTCGWTYGWLTKPSYEQIGEVIANDHIPHAPVQRVIDRIYEDLM